MIRWKTNENLYLSLGFIMFIVEISRIQNQVEKKSAMKL